MNFFFYEIFTQVQKVSRHWRIGTIYIREREREENNLVNADLVADDGGGILWPANPYVTGICCFGVRSFRNTIDDFIIYLFFFFFWNILSKSFYPNQKKTETFWPKRL